MTRDEPGRASPEEEDEDEEEDMRVQDAAVFEDRRWRTVSEERDAGLRVERAVSLHSARIMNNEWRWRWCVGGRS